MAPFDPVPESSLVLSSPLLYALRPVYNLLRGLRPAPKTRVESQPAVRVVCISDTHSLHDTISVPQGDILVHAGDLTNGGTVEELQAAIDWLKRLPHREKVVVAGNHDSWLDERVRKYLQEDDDKVLNWGDIHYLQNSTVSLTLNSRTIVLHGIPQIPTLDPSPPSPSNLHAFQSPPSSTHPFPPPPASTDILLSHSPALHHNDNFPYSLGSTHLLRTLWRIKPALFVSGHVHASPGVERAYYDLAQSSWERMLERRQEGGKLWERGRKGWAWWVFVQGGVWRDVVSVGWAWRDALGVLFGSGWAVLRELLGWGRDGGIGREGWIVNAACMDGRGSGRLVRQGVVIDI